MERRHHRHGTLARTITGILCATLSALATPSFTAYAQAVAESTAAAEAVASADDAAPAESALTGEAAASGSAPDIVTVTADPLRGLGGGPRESSFGFAKSLLETPRAVSFISEEQINLFGISSVEDLTRLVPGTYTTTRYGLQGGVNVRGVPSDMYYRGMKRLQMQGHVRTVLSAMDGIEVVKGPPSPIYGMGRIGGFENFTPKSSRASTGSYMSRTQGFVQTTQGSYNRNEIQAGVGGPFHPGDRQAGYYVYGLFEDSDTYVKQVGAKQKFVQATVAIEDMAGPFRIEFGGQLQNSVTSGAYMNRVTQDLIDHRVYLSGQPMVNLDGNGDGLVGYVESYQYSPVRGRISTANQALNQKFAWPTDASGSLVPVQNFQQVAGIPATMLAYLNAHPEINCRAAEVMRSMPAGGPLPTSGQLPVGFVLDPCTVSTVPLDYRGNGSYEHEQNADQRLAYIDFIADKDPNFTMKYQILYDNIDSFKDSYLPYGENQYIQSIENKFTVTKRVSEEHLPDWVRINMLGSLNYRLVSGWIKSSGGDFDWRQDINYNGGYHYPNTKFWTQLTNPDYATGAAATAFRSSKFNDAGLGAMFDVDLFTNTNVLLGARFDTSEARATDMAPFNANTGVSPALGAACTAPGTGCPGAWITTPSSASGRDSGSSWSVSISQQIGDRWRPYVTRAKASLQLSTANDTLQVSVVKAGHIGSADLKEVGIKASFLEDEKLQWTTAGYEQSRIDISDPADPTDAADVSSTVSTGVETEIRWVPKRNLFLSAYVLNQFAQYVVDSGASISLTARQLGFVDVVDPATGAVLYPAEAFFYGGKASVDLPVNNPQYRERTGNPETQAGLSFSYTLLKGLGVSFGAQFFSETWVDRTRTVTIPAATVYNFGMNWDKEFWHLRLNGYNVTNEHYFRPGGSNPGILSVMPGARWELTAKRQFD